jgi:hypothetical protein
MHQGLTIAITFAAGLGASLLIGPLHAQAPSSAPGALVIQAAPQAAGNLSPVAFVLDTERRRVMACRAPANAVGPGPSCTGWTDLAK